MPCYFINPVLLLVSGCTRTVCIHCRVDIQPTAAQADNGCWYAQVLVNEPQQSAPALPLASMNLTAGSH